jgi:hypothetical protein
VAWRPVAGIHRCTLASRVGQFGDTVTARDESGGRLGQGERDFAPSKPAQLQNALPGTYVDTPLWGADHWEGEGFPLFPLEKTWWPQSPEARVRVG